MQRNLQDGVCAVTGTRPEPAYTTAEMLTVMCSREMLDGMIVFAGVGVPLLGATMAQRRHAPHLTILFEGGIVGPFIEPGNLPPSTNEMRTANKSNMLLNITDVLGLLQRGYVDIGFIGGAQVDQYGNVNSSRIGDPKHPSPRLPGSGGGNDIASLSNTIVMMAHEKKRLVETVDFVTSPGHLNGGNSREQGGLPVGGPKKIITNLCVFGFDETSRRMKVEALHPGVELKDVFDNMSFEPEVADDLGVSRPPEAEELEILRTLDPDRKYIG
jgi:glutaconate CoA-transferase subunit B